MVVCNSHGALPKLLEISSLMNLRVLTRFMFIFFSLQLFSLATGYFCFFRFIAIIISLKDNFYI